MSKKKKHRRKHFKEFVKGEVQVAKPTSDQLMDYHVKNFYWALLLSGLVFALIIALNFVDKKWPFLTSLSQRILNFLIR